MLSGLSAGCLDDVPMGCDAAGKLSGWRWNGVMAHCAGMTVIFRRHSLRFREKRLQSWLMNHGIIWGIDS